MPSTLLVLPDVARLEQIIACPIVGGLDAAAPQRRSEIEQIVADVGPAVLLDQRVERVDCLRVNVVEPGGSYAVAAKLAPMLVRDDVVCFTSASRRRKLLRPPFFVSKAPRCVAQGFSPASSAAVGTQG